MLELVAESIYELTKQEFCDDSDSDEDLTLTEIVVRENEKEVEYSVPMWTDIEMGKFILVDFIGGARKTTQYYYVCLVQSVDPDDSDRLEGFQFKQKRICFKRKRYIKYFLWYGEICSSWSKYNQSRPQNDPYISG